MNISNPLHNTTTVESILNTVIETKTSGGNVKLTARNLINACQKQTVVKLLNFVNKMEDPHHFRYMLSDLARHYMVRCQKLK